MAASVDSSPSLAPHPPTTEIMTPTPVGPPTSQSSPTVGRDNAVGVAIAAQSSSSSGGEGGSSSSLIEDESQATAATSGKSTSDVFKSLGNWSIKEFEGEAMDPFEIASLQAINDMEMLQSVLQPMQTPATAPLPATSSSPSVSSHSTSQSSVQSSPNLNMLVTNLAITTTAAIASPVGVSGVTHATLLSHAMSPNTDPRTLTTPASQVPARRIPPGGNTQVSYSGSGTPLSSTQLNPREVTNPFVSGAVQRVVPVQAPPINASTTSTNPFLSSEPIQSFTAASVSALSPQQWQQEQAPPRSHSEPGVGTLVDLSGRSPNHTPQVKPPIPAPRSPKVLTDKLAKWKFSVKDTLGALENRVKL